MTRTVALVTGGSRGIGRAIVARLVRRGYSVVFTYTSDEAGATETVAEAAASGGSVRALRCDVTDPDGPERMIAASEDLGDLVIVVNNAGVTGPIGPVATVADDTVARVLDVNLVGALRVCREVVRRWEGRAVQADRSIVNVSSIAARTGAPGEYVWYAASKAGVEALTVGLAKEVAAAGIRVNAVSPGTTDTTIHARAGRSTRAAEVGARSPLGRPANPDEIAAAVEWLTTSDAGYVTGTVLDVAGGVR
ncbi:SDR family oxidoreductase [Microbacterium sp. ET2]|uniref:SDR family NAD(P)-dependent oxidoreductase n=1 Tax=Microbacterium albipurpureum TaxID=3050384 RepID=UPI00259C91DB|nr:SDR family oxidoreductase [Microbacterium sp. ET2 (Ac-2212)]WJL94931.1 SDR family oxidoreductase [Microbacterium sp. ET2 (Ac-2212)]